MGEVHYKLLCRLKTGSMSADTSRSEQVIEDYKRHKLARSALRHIEEIVRGFEEGRALDLRLAQSGLVVILALIAGSVYFLLNADSLTLF
jgi:hypothetical protein